MFSSYQWLFWNQLPVTLGNLMGGAIFTGMFLYSTYGNANPAPVLGETPAK